MSGMAEAFEKQILEPETLSSGTIKYLKNRLVEFDLGEAVVIADEEFVDLEVNKIEYI